MSSLADSIYDVSVATETAWPAQQLSGPPFLRLVDTEEEEVGLDLPQQPRVLLAEDDEQMRSLLSEELTAAGYRVFAVSNGKDLFRCLKGHRSACPTPDLVVSDIRMPGVTGIEALRSLRRSDWTMPVIMITAFGDAEIHAEARRLGAATVLDKPFDVDELVHAARSLVPTEI